MGLILGASAASAQPAARVLDTFELRDVPMRGAFAAWSARAGVPLVVDWAALEAEGFDPDRRVSLTLSRVPAAAALRLLMRYAAAGGFTELVLEVHPTFLELLTKRQALTRPIVRVYDIRDLLMDIPHFTDAPRLDLASALSNTSSGRSGGGASGREGLFGDDRARDEPRPLTHRERGEQLAQLIRDTIEPDIWRIHGGEHAAIRYYDGRLIVRAPQYVHGVVRQRVSISFEP